MGRVLRATVGNVWDHVIISLALGTGLRLAEIVGLNVGDVFAPNGTPRTRVRVRKEIAKGRRAADVFLPDRLVPKLRKLWRLKKARGEDLSADAALFCNQSRVRISKRRVKHAWSGHREENRCGERVEGGNGGFRAPGGESVR